MGLSCCLEVHGHDAQPQVTSLDAARYEVSHTEDVLQIAFHTPGDAVGWCLKAQILLLNAAWPPELEDIAWPASQSPLTGMALCTLSRHNNEAALMACCGQMDHVIATALSDSEWLVDMQQASMLLTWCCMQAQCLEQACQNLRLDWRRNPQQRFVYPCLTLLSSTVKGSCRGYHPRSCEICWSWVARSTNPRCTWPVV